MTPRSIYPGIYRITLPIPGEMPGPVNVYLFKGRDNITLLDSGTILSIRSLKKGLAQLGLKIKDLDRIILTHGHVDHYGGAKAMCGKSYFNAKVYAHHDDIRAIESGAEVPPKTYRQFLSLAGAPVNVRIAISTIYRATRFFFKGGRVDYSLKDGDTLMMGDYEARIIATPGHTRGSICIYLEKEGGLFSGDHILGHVTPNPLVMLEENRILPSRMSQREYTNSLNTIADLDPKVIHPAHGEVIEGFGAIHRIYKTSYSQRRRRILTSVKASPGKSIYRIAREIFPQLNAGPLIMSLFLAISEIYTHIQVLEAEGYVQTDIRNKQIFVEAI